MKLFAENTGAVAFFLGSSQASMFTANMYKKSTYPESTTAYALAELGVSMRVLFLCRILVFSLAISWPCCAAVKILLWQ